MVKSSKFLFLGLLLFVFSCKKDPDKIHTTIIARDAVSLKALPNTIVSVYKGVDPYWAAPMEFVQEVITNGKGEYTFKYDTDASTFYYIYLKRDGYLSTEQPYKIDKGVSKKDSKSILMDSKAYIKVHIKNANPVDGTDNISFPVNCNTAPSLVFTGSAIDTTFMLLADGCDPAVARKRPKLVRYFVMKKVSDTDFAEHAYETMVLPSEDTTLIDISY